jgi:hypothetical protein
VSVTQSHPSSAGPAWRALDALAHDVVAAAGEEGLALRTLGGVGVWQRLGTGRPAYEAVRPVAGDVDFLGPAKSEARVKRVLEKLGGVPDERVNAWHGDRRQVWSFARDDGVSLDIDVFLGRPPLCHALEFADRLALPGVAMSPADLLLQKLQIVRCNHKDLIDVVALLAEHPLEGGPGPAGIDVDRVVGPAARDWGFFHTATTNLARVGEAATGLVRLGVPAATERAAALTAAMHAAPKSRRWAVRARVGTRVPWYQEVEDLER